MPYKQKTRATFHDLPAAALGLMDTLLSIKAEYRGTAVFALQSEFFTTEPLSCDPSSLPKCPPRKEIDAKMTEIKESRDRKYARDRSIRENPAANVELQRSVHRRQLLNQNQGVQQKREHRELYSNSSTPQRTTRKEQIQKIKGKKWSSPLDAGPSQRGRGHDPRRCSTCEADQISAPLPAKSINMQGLPRDQHEARFLKDTQIVISYTETMAEAKGDDSKEEKNLHIRPLPTSAESTLFDFLQHNQSFHPLPAASKSINVDRLLREHDMRQATEN
ncbi:Cyclin-dependent kinase 12 [Datura stramonium]|uniref:Cyclin-dependent kinase 12 n=1 Tax=Datura stramonium TaxID=4076 RepID=A0ABS8WKZ8_DATST|nr:Cyclin-dependent kinase 12 [Datura stramonium]